VNFYDVRKEMTGFVNSGHATNTNPTYGADSERVNVILLYVLLDGGVQITKYERVPSMDAMSQGVRREWLSLCQSIRHITKATIHES